MENGRGRLTMIFGTVAAIGLLLAAFVAIWLIPRGPVDSSASIVPGVTGASVSSGKSSSGATLAQTGGQVGTSTDVGSQAHITVRGTGIVTAKPDMVNLQVGVQAQKSTLSDAQAEASASMDAIMKQLKDAGIDDKDISTAQYSVEPVTNYQDNQPPQVTGFRVTNILNVKIRDISKASTLIDSLVKSGANTIYGVSFGFSDPSALMNQAREQAMNDARSKAAQLAGLASVTLGAPIAIEDLGQSVPPTPIPMSTLRSALSSDASVPQITPGQQQVQVDLNVVYAIK